MGKESDTVFANEVLESESPVFKKCISVKIMGNRCELKILCINQVLRINRIERHLSTLHYGSLRIHGKSILLFEMRKNAKKLKKTKATVVVVEALNNSVTIPVGFIVESVEDFYQLLQ